MFKFGKLTSLKRNEISIKQKERVQKYGEVFTPSNIVNDMLDLLPVEDGNLILDSKDGTKKSFLTSTFFEPSCGDGNFLVEILNRKLNLVSRSSLDRDVLLAISSCYGVDIQADNVLECRRRLLGVIEDFYEDIKISDEQYEKLNEILYRNIVLGNTLTSKMIYLSNNGEALKEDGSSEGVFFVEANGKRIDTYDRLTLDGQSFVYPMKFAEYKEDLTYDMVLLDEDEKVSEPINSSIAHFQDMFSNLKF